MANKFHYFRSVMFPTVIETENLMDIFHPFKNEFFKQDMRLEEFIELTTLLTKPDTMTFEKIVELWPRGAASWHLFVKNLVENHPDLLPYLFIAEYHSHHTNEYSVACIPRADRSSSVDYTYAANAADAVTKMRAFKDRVNHQARLDHLPFYYSCTFFSRLLRYTRDSSACFYIDEQNLRPSQVRSGYTENMFAGITISSDDDYDYLFQPVWSPNQPATRSRASFYRVFSHNQDVTRLLGTGTQAKQDVKVGDKVISVNREYAPNLYGVELEASTNKSIQEIIDAQAEVFLLGKHDGTISGSKRTMVELVTRPQDLRTHRRAWAKFMGNFYDRETATYPDWDVTRNTNNGMHVHIDRAAFADDAHQKRFAYFFAHPLTRDFVIAISERDAATMSRWAQFPSWSSNSTDRVIYDRALEHFDGMGKYSAVNLQKSATIEIRIFKGLFSYATIMKNLEFCDAALEFTRSLGVAQLTVEGFNNWINALPTRRYKSLRLFISKMDVESMIEDNKQKRMFQGCKTPEAAFKIITSRKIPHSKALVSYLNVRFGGKKVFHWDNKKGIMVLNHEDKAKLFAFDGELQDLYSRSAPVTTSVSSPAGLV